MVLDSLCGKNIYYKLIYMVLVTKYSTNYFNKTSKIGSKASVSILNWP